MLQRNLELFSALNEEYKNKPLIRRPRAFSRAALKVEGDRRVQNLDRIFSRSAKRPLGIDDHVLEIGTGRGNTAKALAEAINCTVMGLDIIEYNEWESHKNKNLDLRVHDITVQEILGLGQFDFIYSFAVWEHIKHPFAALVAAYKLLKPDGIFYFSANLYRGPKASHRYRQVYFPWPHLIFDDSVFEEFYILLGQKPTRPAWVNKLVSAEYDQYIRQIGFVELERWFNITAIDEPFYDRFDDILSRYPRFDLERDFIHLILTKKVPQLDQLMVIANT
jgi:SAM-dependent methyltransferase